MFGHYPNLEVWQLLAYNPHSKILDIHFDVQTTESSGLCTHSEGWGPFNPIRYDLTPCFEYSMITILSLAAIIAFISRIYHLSHYGIPHNLGRTWWIYWPTQIFMSLASLSFLVLSAQYFSVSYNLPIAGWGYLSMGTAWALAVLSNRYEHEYDIRSSSAIYAFYVLSMGTSLYTIKTLFDLNLAEGSAYLNLVISTLFLTIGFIVEAWPRGSTKVQKASPVGLYEKANLGSRLLFSFYFPFIKIGLTRSLTQEDLLGQLPKNMEIDVAHKHLDSAWKAHLRKKKSAKETPSLFATILISSWPVLVPVLISRIAIVLFSYTLPVLLKELLNYLETYESKPLSYGVTLAICMFLSSLMASLLNTYNRYQMLLIGVRIRAGLIAMIYRKSLRLSVRSRNETSSGEITNHMSVDADQWWDMVVQLSMWVSIPIEVIISMRLLYSLLGWTMLAGVTAMLALIPIQTWQAKVIKRMQRDKLKAMDQRIHMTTDVLASMKIIKLYGWGQAFMDRILEIREKELDALKRMGVVQAYMSIIFISSSLIISLITFSVYALVGGPDFTPGQLTPQTVFVSMTLFAMLRGPIASLSDVTSSTIGVLVATKRIQDFLLKEEVNDTDVLRFDNLPRDKSEPVIFIKDATFSWTGPEEEEARVMDERSALLTDRDSSTQVSIPPTLQSINLFVSRGSLTAIVGRVGQGKSSMLSALISDMYKLHGKVQISGKVAYVPQQAWIINKTLRENILFGKEFDEDRYKRVISACSLEPDLAILPAGDMTEIGERGINLSGGQKQRVSLARAAYCNADIYLMDDPLSAVDAHVDKHIWNNVIGPSGMLSDKTRLLVTHGIHHLREVDQIVLLNGGTIAENGTYSELMTSKKAFYRLIKEYSIQERRRSHSGLLEGKKDKEGRRKSTDVIESLDNSGEEVVEAESEISTGDEASITDGTSEASVSDQGTVKTTEELKDEKKDTNAQLTTVEVLKYEEVGYDVIIKYAKAVSYRMSAAIVCMFLLAQGCLVLTSLWLKHWISKSDESPSILLFLGVYALITAVYVLLYVVVMWLLFAVARIRASRKIFYDILDKVIHLPIAFFDTTPLGRIINRFSADVTQVDIRMTGKLSETLLLGISVTSTLLLIIFTIPAFIFVVPFMLLGYRLIVKSFLSVSRVLVRLYSITKSPVYQHFNESQGGVSTMRAMRMQGYFIEVNSALSDRMSNNFLCNMSSRRWMDVQLRLVSTMVLLCAALFAVLARSSMDPSLVGLTLSFTISIAEEVTGLVRVVCDLQNTLIAVERILEYTNLNTEAPDITDYPIPANWPSQGRITFQNYSTRYREGLDLVLKNLDIDIAPTEKVGIVGRTGAGKSSLTLALFRVIEAANSYWAKASDNSNNLSYSEAIGSATEPLLHSRDDEEIDGGKILIDGIDISEIGLAELRQHLAIIPQDPTLFAGTVRQNLDPFNEVQDVDLWEALNRSHLKETISGLPGGLSFEVSQNGENFSVGQRSLMCLARALLRKTKILILDEATSAVDVETDELIQKTIREEFKDRTILTIAHRIKTVMDSDKILVMERGRVSEFESPQTLLENKNSLFYKLAEQAGEI